MVYITVYLNSDFLVDLRVAMSHDKNLYDLSNSLPLAILQQISYLVSGLIFVAGTHKRPAFSNRNMNGHFWVGTGSDLKGVSEKRPMSQN